MSSKSYLITGFLLVTTILCLWKITQTVSIKEAKKTLSLNTQLNSYPTKAKISNPYELSWQRIEEGAQFIRAISQLQQLRKFRLHDKKLEFSEFDEKIMLNQAKQVLFNSRRSIFDENEENNRLATIDYLGEKLRGRIQTAYREKVYSLLVEHLEFDVLASNLELRKKQSLIGDQIEIMDYVTQYSIPKAQMLLKIAQAHPKYRFWREGFENGLWYLGKLKTFSHDS